MCTDHKPLTFALRARPDKHSPRQARYLDFIAQFTTDIRHLPGQDNAAADTLSRMEVDALEHPADSPWDVHTLATAQRQEEAPTPTSTSLTLQSIPVPTTNITILCDMSTGTPRPYVPPSLRRPIFDHYHSLSHPGVRATQRLLTSRFVWPRMNAEVRQWTRACIKCQRSKVHTHTVSPLGTFLPPDARFAHVHVDLVGPLPPSQGYTYLLTCVDRFTRWPEAIPLPNITTEAVAHAFLSGWISRFGVPTTLTSDRGSQFESGLWSQLMNLLGIHRTRTTAYHPCANGLVERFHRQLKAALMARSSNTWVLDLPLVLLGIRSSLKVDLKCSAAEMVYGTTLRLPGDFFSLSPAPSTNVSDPLSYVDRLKSTMSRLTAVPPRKPSQNTPRVPTDLSSCTHVFIRQDGVRRSLQPPYTGPFTVIRRKPKYFTIQVKGQSQSVSIDRLKPAFPLEETPATVPSTQPLSIGVGTDSPAATQQQPDTAPPVPELRPVPTITPARTTRSGRQVRWPDRLTF